MRVPRIRACAVAVLCAVLAVGLAAGPAIAPAAAQQTIPPLPGVTLTDSTFTVRKDVTSVTYPVGGPAAGAPTPQTRTITLTVGQTADLRGRQRVEVAWAGAQPTNPTPPVAYPMVLMQCRGTTPEPSDCLNSNRQGDRLFALAADPGYGPGEGANNCGAPGSPPGSYQLPYRAIDGTMYRFCEQNTDDPTPYAPDFRAPGDRPVLPPTQQAGQTGADGTGTARLELRTAVDQPTFGCSATVPCSLVAVPMMQFTCATELPEGPVLACGLPLINNADFARWLQMAYWYLPSQWANRIVVPLQFTPTAADCDRGDTRPRVSVVGTELMREAATSWANNACLGDGAYRLQYSPAGDGPARRQVAVGPQFVRDAAFVSRPPVEPDRALGYAPVGVTGFAVSYVAYDFDRRRIDTPLRLTPRLLAKMFTQSYNAGDISRATTPDSYPPGRTPPPTDLPLGDLFSDPEFRQINPDFPEAPPAPYPTFISVESDVIWELTRYLDADPQARAWLDQPATQPGAAGVNPRFAGIDLPTAEVELRDTVGNGRIGVGAEGKPDLQDLPCLRAGAVPWLTVAMNPQPLLIDGSVSVLDSWSLARTLCQPNSDATLPSTYQRQPYSGVANVLAITPVAEAELFDLDTALLQVTGKPDTYVGPTLEAMRAAMATTVTDQASGTVSIDHARLAADAYPGTMPVYTAVPTEGLSAQDAANTADFLRQAVGRYQEPGERPGQLPDGYVPLTAANGLGALVDQALRVADAVAAQGGGGPPPSDGGPPGNPGPGGGGGGSPGAGGSGGTGDGNQPGARGNQPGGPGTPGGPPAPGGGPGGGGTPPGAGPAGPGDPPTVAALPTSATRVDVLDLFGWLLPLLLGTGLIAAVAGPVLLLRGNPSHPVYQAAMLALSRIRPAAHRGG